jgi:DNA-binding MarR family transcriptional regulator
VLADYFVFTNFIKRVYTNFPYDLSLQQMVIVHEIGERQDLTMQRVAEKVVIDSTTFSRQISSLEKKGLVERTPSRQDRRFYFLTLTTKGSAVLAEMHTLFDQHFKDLFEGVNEFEKEMIFKSFKALTDRMND